MEDGKPVVDSTDVAAEAPSAASEAPSGAAEAPAGAESVEGDLVAERDRLIKEKEELYDRLLRRQAEFENFRRRTERERNELFEFAGMETIRAMLPVLDDFERALKVECADREYARGMELIYQRLLESLKKLGLEPVEALGKPFDPNSHHAVEMVKTSEADDHTVIEEYQQGYNFRGRLLRPAMVKVAVAP